MAKKKVTVEDKTEGLIKGAKDLIASVATERDSLRTTLEELEDVHSSLTDAIEDIQSGLHLIESGLDRMSEYL